MVRDAKNNKTGFYVCIGQKRGAPSSVLQISCRLTGAVDTTEGREANERNLEKLKKGVLRTPS